MGAMSLLEQRHAPARRASVSQVVAGTIATICALPTAYAAGLIAYNDVIAPPNGIRGQQYDELGRPFTGLAEVWHEYSSLLWLVFAIVLLVAVGRTWRAVVKEPPSAVWWHVVVVLAASAAFWVVTMNAGRFTF